jgi:phosphoglycolate phosphatase
VCRVACVNILRLKIHFVALAVGFDLDLTLLDTRPGIGAAWYELARRTGAHIDVDLVTSRIGPPLRQELAEWFPAAEVEPMLTLYRSLYAEHAIPPTVPLPGAVAAVQAVRDEGGAVVVITSKLGRLAEAHLAHAGIAVDAVYGEVFAEEKGVVLKSFGAFAMVGDHVGDMRAGAHAGTHAVGVTTGPCSAMELSAAGATVVLGSLTEFPGWLRKTPDCRPDHPPQS